MIVPIYFEVPDEAHAERLIYFLDKLCGLKFEYTPVNKIEEQIAQKES